MIWSVTHQLEQRGLMTIIITSHRVLGCTVSRTETVYKVWRSGESR